MDYRNNDGTFMQCVNIHDVGDEARGDDDIVIQEYQHFTASARRTFVERYHLSLMLLHDYLGIQQAFFAQQLKGRIGRTVVNNNDLNGLPRVGLSL